MNSTRSYCAVLVSLLAWLLVVPLLIIPQVAHAWLSSPVLK